VAPTCSTDVGVGELFTSECRDEEEDAFELWCPFWRAHNRDACYLVLNVTMTRESGQSRRARTPSMMYHSQDNWSGDLRAASNQVLFAGKFVIAMIYIGHALNKKKAVLFKLFPKKKDVILYSIPIPSSPHTTPPPPTTLSSHHHQCSHSMPIPDPSSSTRSSNYTRSKPARKGKDSRYFSTSSNRAKAQRSNRQEQKEWEVRWYTRDK